MHGSDGRDAPRASQNGTISYINVVPSSGRSTPFRSSKDDNERAAGVAIAYGRRKGGHVVVDATKKIGYMQERERGGTAGELLAS